MEENVQQNEEGLSLIYIIRLLFSKIKWLILACLIGGFLGGVFGVIRTYDMKYYGTSIEFYVNPEKAVSAAAVTNTTSSTGSQYGVYGSYGNNVMDTMINLLEAENFTELAEKGVQQTPAALNGLWIVYALIPVIGMIISTFFYLGYKLNDKDVQIMAKCNSGEITRAEAEALLSRKY